jgi:hypothetical protein
VHVLAHGFVANLHPAGAFPTLLDEESLTAVRTGAR